MHQADIIEKHNANDFSWMIANTAHMSDYHKVKDIIERVEFEVFVGYFPMDKKEIDADADYKKLNTLFIKEVSFDVFWKITDKNKVVYFLRDCQDGDLGNIENEIFLLLDEIIERFSKTYFVDYEISIIDNPNLSTSLFNRCEFNELKAGELSCVTEKQRLEIEENYRVRNGLDNSESMLYALQDSIEPEDFDRVINDDNILSQINEEVEKTICSNTGDQEIEVLKGFVNFVNVD